MTVLEAQFHADTEEAYGGRRTTRDERKRPENENKATRTEDVRVARHALQDRELVPVQQTQRVCGGIDKSLLAHLPVILTAAEPKITNDICQATDAHI